MGTQLFSVTGVFGFTRRSMIHALFPTSMLLLALVCSGCAGPVSQGNIALLSGDYQAAESAFQDILKENPENLTVRRRLAMTYYYMGRDQDTAKFEQAVEQFDFLKSRRTLNPEEQFYRGLSLIGLGRRTEGFDLLTTISHPTKFRIQQLVRERASQLAPYQELSARMIFSEMEKAWREGDALDKQEQIEERRDDPFHRRSPVPLW